MLDVLVFSPHPDDAELGCGGAIVKAVKNDLAVGIIDMTAGEKGTYGTKKIRIQEAQAAQKILGFHSRENLHLPDSSISYNISKKTVYSVATKIREYQPTVIITPYWLDRHPDHKATTEIVTQACHIAKLKKIDLDYEPHKTQQVIFYEINQQTPFTLIMDISEEFPLKKKAILAYQSQFKEFSKDYLPFPVEERCKYYGSLIGVDYGEAYLMKNPLQINSWEVLLKQKMNK